MEVLLSKYCSLQCNQLIVTVIHSYPTEIASMWKSFFAGDVNYVSTGKCWFVIKC